MLNRISIALASASIALFALPTSAAPGLQASYAPAANAADGGGPAKLAALLAKYDAMKPGADRDKLALDIDRVAGQRYATVSRLYWYQNLADAKAAAAKQKRPILHLRMLGRLDEDLSCANSRFFRTTLYANTETANYLRDNFVLYWSSERPVPKVTIDFGDGRKIERTTTGNSAHYVMDERGNVLDVLPGLYAPVVFRQELAKSVGLANKVRKLSEPSLVEAVVAFHQKELEAANKQYAAVAGTEFVVRRGRLIGASEIGQSAVARAQRATMSKAMVEVVDLAKIGIDAGEIDAKDIAQWATVGQKVWNIGLSTQTQQAPRQPVGQYAPKPLLLDNASVALIEKVRAGNPTPMAKDALVARLEQAILADTALNQFRLRNQIRNQIIYGKQLGFDAMNDWIYASVFHTPKSDTWLGLLENTDFTGVPADGVIQ